MKQIKFSYGEAISRAWDMTIKHWKIILILAVFYLIANLFSAVTSHFAGNQQMHRYALFYAFTDKTEADQIYQHFQTAGYINEAGHVQEKLQNVKMPSDLDLTPQLENRREDIFRFLAPYRYRLPFPRPVYYGLIVLLWIIHIFMAIWMTQAYLMISRDQDPDITELFSNGRLFIPYLLGWLCYSLAVLGGFILLIVPGFVFAVMFQMYPYLIVDKRRGPIQSLKDSREITRGSKGRLFVFGLLLLAINMAGLLCLGLGLLLTMPLTGVAMAYVYDCLDNPEIESVPAV